MVLEHYYSGLEQTDHVNRMIKLTVITLSGFYCSFKFRGPLTFLQHLGAMHPLI